MSPMEFRPGTAQDMRGSAAGECSCGCSAARPATGPRARSAAREYPLGAPPGVESLLLDYAANADGRWAPTWDSWQAELATLEVVIEELFSSGIALMSDEESNLEHFVQGIESAASWTLGLKPASPLSTRSPAPVCNAVIAENLAEAEKMIAGLQVDRWFAEGVRTWLLWITGRIPGIVYPLG